MEAIRDRFEGQGYVLLPAVVQRRMLDSLLKHALNFAKSPRARIGVDRQCPGTPSAYADPVMERVLLKLLPRLEELTGRRLYQSYSFFRVYRHGDILHRHTDRPACEISMSLCLGYQGAETWPLYVEGPKGVFAAKLEPGDGLLYKGTECHHWREPFSGESAAQLFLHYVDRAGPCKEWRFDKRPWFWRWVMRLRTPRAWV